MPDSMTFNGIRKPHIYLLEGREKAPFHPISRNVVSTRKGYRLKDSKRELLLINQPIGYLFNDNVDALRIKDELASWLVTKDIASLQFDDEPGRTYWVVVQNSIDNLRRFAFTRQGTIQFLCFYTTGESKSINVATTAQTHTITGQVETPWTVEVTFTANTNRFELWAGDTYLQLNYNFIAGDKLTVSYEGRKVFLNGNDLRKAVSMSSHYEELKPGTNSFRATHNCVLKYDERYY